jgi:hypothetical protein
MLNYMKRHLTECRERSNKKFDFGTILCSFLFERVPSLSPRETVWGHVASFPLVCKWAALLPRMGGGRTIEAFDDKLFDWWARHILVIENYPYAGINFSRDPDMPMPPGEERGELGMSFLRLFNFQLLIYIIFYMYQSIDNYVFVYV